MKSILIATPCLYGKVDAYYVNSLCESIKLGLKFDLHLKAIFLANESILPMARNELINLAYNQKYDSLVFVDDDELWDPMALIEIIQSEKDVVACPVVNKGDQRIEYNVYYDVEKVKIDPIDGYFPVPKVGTGFLKISKKAITDLVESAPEVKFRQHTIPAVFDYGHLNGQFVGEDILLCRKLTELGYKIWINPKYTVSHMGPKMYVGDFEQSIRDWYDKK